MLILPNITETTLRACKHCNCGKCRATNSADVQIVCCQKRETIKRKLHLDGSSHQCITQTRSLKVICLDEDVLNSTFKLKIDLRKRRRKQVREERNNSSRRWTAYRQFFLWICHAYLGCSVRKVLPRCVQESIRELFPSETGLYSDSQQGENDDIHIEYKLILRETALCCRIHCIKYVFQLL